MLRQSTLFKVSSTSSEETNAVLPEKVNKFKPIDIEIGTIFKDERRMCACKWKVIERMERRTDKSEYVVWNMNTREWCAMRVYKRAYENYRIDVEENILRSLTDHIMLPTPQDFGRSGECRFQIMSLWGPTIQELMDDWKPHGGLHEEDILKLALGSLMSLKELHRAGYAHCDVRPINFAVPFLSGQSPIVMQIDFDFCKPEFSSSDEECESTTTPREKMMNFLRMPDNFDFSSKKFLKEWKHGRADDIESWLYMVINMYVPLLWLGEKDMKVLIKEREKLKAFLEKQQKVKFLIPILDLIPRTENLQHFLPKLLKIGDILLGRLKQIKGTVTGKWHFEQQCIHDRTMAVDPKAEKRSEEETISFIRFFLSRTAVDQMFCY